MFLLKSDVHCYFTYKRNQDKDLTIILVIATVVTRAVESLRQLHFTYLPLKIDVIANQKSLVWDSSSNFHCDETVNHPICADNEQINKHGVREQWFILWLFHFYHSCVNMHKWTCTPINAWVHACVWVYVNVFVNTRFKNAMSSFSLCENRNNCFGGLSV